MNDENNAENSTLKKQKTSWHRLLARVLELDSRFEFFEEKLKPGILSVWY